MKILVTGAAGFIGAGLVRRLLETEAGVDVTGIDNLNDYYDVRLKEYRLERIRECSAANPSNSFRFICGDISDRETLDGIFAEGGFDVVVNLAAQTGVRNSIDNPDAYIESNIIGFYNILEACRHHPVKHLIFASSSSIYGNREDTPFRETDNADRPVSLYAATKRSDELMAHTYSHLYGIPCTGLRFFTVYGPEGRPDMAYFGFAEKLQNGEKIRIFNHGRCLRDFTYIDDAVSAVRKVIGREPAVSGFKIYNIGNSHPENLLDFVETLASELIEAGVLPSDYDFRAHCEMLPMQPGDVASTCADVSAFERDYGFRPSTPLRDGLRAFARWYAGWCHR